MKDGFDLTHCNIDQQNLEKVRTPVIKFGSIDFKSKKIIKLLKNIFKNQNDQGVCL